MRDLIFIHGAGGDVDTADFGSQKLFEFLQEGFGHAGRAK